ncbi:MAG: hypothetical protein ACR652_25105 [Methylocystis sp.]|uniref:hypothetical protein n=1 Tax=Methylocystis sp. TaxID=1911079 RepID=UPI003DA23EF3
MSPERKNLAAAIKAYHVAQHDVERAEDMMQRAYELSENLELKCEQFNGLDEEIAAANAANVAHAIEHGETSLLTERPQGFASKIVARDHALAELASVNEALPVLQEQLEAAKQRLYQCDATRELAAEKVIVAEANAMAVAHLEKLNELRIEHYVMNFLAMQQVKRGPTERVVTSAPGYLYGPGPTRRIQMSETVILAASENIIGTHELKKGPFLRDAIGAQVASYCGALKDDAGATLEIEELKS